MTGKNHFLYLSTNDVRQLVWIEEDVHGKALQYEIVGSNMEKEYIIG